MYRRTAPTLILFLCLISLVPAHEHHEHNIPPGKSMSAAPIDIVLWLHIVLQTITWLVIFPVGLVLGIARSRWHVPIQVGGILLAITGHVLGHAHGGREFRLNPHAQMASVLETWLAVQTGLGIYLKLHLKHRGSAPLRRYVVALHAILAFGIPVLAWSQVLLGAFTAAGFCHGDNSGQCVARAGSGSAMVAVGIWLRVTASQTISRQSRQSLTCHELLENIAVGLSSNMNLLAIWATKKAGSGAVSELLSVGLMDLCSCAVVTAICTRYKKSITGKALAGLSLVVHGSYIFMQSVPSDGTSVSIAVGLFMQAAGLCMLAESTLSRLSGLVTAPSGISDAVVVVRHCASFFLVEGGLLFVATNREQLDSLARDGESMSQATLVLLLCSAGVLLFGLSSEVTVFLQENRASTFDYGRVEQEDEGKASGSLQPANTFVIDETMGEQ